MITWLRVDSRKKTMGAKANVGIKAFFDKQVAMRAAT